MMTREQVISIREAASQIAKHGVDDPAIITKLCEMAIGYLAMQPRPISDAPKDGRWLLCWHKNHMDEMFTAAWHDRKGEFCDLPDGDRFDGGFKADYFIPLSSIPKVKP